MSDRYDEPEGGWAEYDVLNPANKPFIEDTFTAEEHAMLMDCSPFVDPIDPDVPTFWDGDQGKWLHGDSR